MATYLGKSCSFGLPRVPFVNCRQFMYLVISLLGLRAGCGIWLYQFVFIACLFTLSLDIYSKYIGTFSKFRCSAHNLLVEPGRYTGIPYQQRVCSFCPLHEIEEEYHFVFICPLYSDVRDLYFPEKCKHCTTSLELFYEMMKSKNEYVVYHVMKCIFFAFIKREKHRIE